MWMRGVSWNGVCTKSNLLSIVFCRKSKVAQHGNQWWVTRDEYCFTHLYPNILSYVGTLFMGILRVKERSGFFFCHIHLERHISAHRKRLSGAQVSVTISWFFVHHWFMKMNLSLGSISGDGWSWHSCTYLCPLTHKDRWSMQMRRESLRLFSLSGSLLNYLFWVK